VRSDIAAPRGHTTPPRHGMTSPPGSGRTGVTGGVRLLNVETCRSSVMPPTSNVTGPSSRTKQAPTARSGEPKGEDCEQR